MHLQIDRQFLLKDPNGRWAESHLNQASLMLVMP